MKDKKVKIGNWEYLFSYTKEGKKPVILTFSRELRPFSFSESLMEKLLDEYEDIVVESHDNIHIVYGRNPKRKFSKEMEILIENVLNEHIFILSYKKKENGKEKYELAYNFELCEAFLEDFPEFYKTEKGKLLEEKIEKIEKKAIEFAFKQKISNWYAIPMLQDSLAFNGWICLYFYPQSTIPGIFLFEKEIGKMAEEIIDGKNAWEDVIVVKRAVPSMPLYNGILVYTRLKPQYIINKT